MRVLTGKTAIVTGSGRGIGRAIAGLLAAQGARVVISDRDADAAADAAAAIGGETAVVADDLTRSGAPEHLVDTAIREFGGLDIVVNNAGYAWDAPVHKLRDQQFQAMLDIHTVVPFRLLRAAAPHMRAQGKLAVDGGPHGKVVNVSSISGTAGNGGQAGYSSGKAALIGLTKTLAKEWGRLKINVNAVAFGFVETRLNAPQDEVGSMEIEGHEIKLGVPREIRRLGASFIPLGRPATPAEAAGPVFFLCSPWSNYVHGQVLEVTGGLEASLDARIARELAAPC